MKAKLTIENRFAGVQGLEPQLTVPETVVLPLDDTPIFIFHFTIVLSSAILVSGTVPGYVMTLGRTKLRLSYPLKGLRFLQNEYILRNREH